MDNFDLNKLNEFVDKIQDIITGERFAYAYFAFCAICYDANQRGILSDKNLEDFPNMAKKMGEYINVIY